MKSWDDADPAAATVYAAAEHHDINATLVVSRPQTDREWAAWHARRDMARRVVGKVRSNNTDADQATILAAMGLDPDSEAKLLAHWK
jgi:hypothetical protein